MMTTRNRLHGLVLLLSLLLPATSLAEDGYTYVYAFTSDCITHLKIESSKDGKAWALVISLSDTEAENLRTFTGNHVGDNIRLVDGNGFRVSNIITKIRQTVSSPFVVRGLESRESANELADQIREASGDCGILI